MFGSKNNSDNSNDTFQNSKMPAHRDYDFNEFIPEDVPEYKEHGNEQQRIEAVLEQRDETDQLPRILISGETGCGKTHLIRSIANEKDIPLITIQGRYSMDESTLLGHPILVNDETVWSDGPLTKALLASQEGEVILLIDEANRARPEAKGALFSALDDRCKVELDARGGETVEGVAENLIVVATINEGTEYAVQEMDAAEKRRFGNKYEVQYLGLTHADKETDLVTERTPASQAVAEQLVDAANAVRREADKSDSGIGAGIPTSNVITWAQTAYAYNQADVDNPVVEAARDAIVKPMYEDREKDSVLNTIRDYTDGAPFDDDEFKDWKNDEWTAPN